jgi:hypothetical protein
MRSDTTVIANVRVGPPDVKPTAPAHVPGVFQGNRHHLLQRPKGMMGMTFEGPDRAEGGARRSTGIRPSEHDVIDPRMPRLSPP